MGAFAAFAPYVLAAAGYAANETNQQQIREKEDKTLTAQLLRNAARDKDAQAEVNKTITAQATSTPDDERSTLLQGLNQALTANRAASTAGVQGTAGASNQYAKDAAAAALGIADTGQRQANLASRLDAPILQRQNEAQNMRKLKTATDLIGDDARTDDYLTKLKLRGITGSPFLRMIGAIAGGASQTVGSGGGGTTNPGSVSNFGSEAGTWYSDPSLRGKV